MKIGRYCYSIGKFGSLTHSVATATCFNEGLSLLTVESEEEYLSIQDYLKNTSECITHIMVFKMYSCTLGSAHTGNSE